MITNLPFHKCDDPNQNDDHDKCSCANRSHHDDVQSSLVRVTPLAGH